MVHKGKVRPGPDTRLGTGTKRREYHLYAGAVYHLGDIYKYGMERLREKEDKN